MLPDPNYDRCPPFDSAQVDEAARAEALKLFHEQFDDFQRSWSRAPRPNLSAALPGALGEKLRALQCNGFVALSLAPEAKAEIVTLAKAALDVVRAQSEAAQGKVKFADASDQLDRSAHGALYARVAAGLEECGACAIGAAYSRSKLAIKVVAAQINTAERTRGKFGPIDSDGLPKRKSAYWHVDSNISPPIKILIYLNKIGGKQGPFRYVVGSHLAMDEEEALIRKTNDKLKLRPHLFMALPPAFRKHAMFGDYLKPDDNSLAALLSKERAVTGDDGDIVLFDNNGVHRGGFVRVGQREILQVTFEPLWRKLKPAPVSTVAAEAVA